MTLEFQQVWGELIVFYLFLGGLGGASLCLAAIVLKFPGLLSRSSSSPDDNSNEQQSPHRTFALIMGVSGVGFIGLGSIFLLFDLFRLEAIIYFSNPASWVFWGTLFIMLALLGGTLLSWMQIAPHLEKLSLRINVRWLASLFSKLAKAGMKLRRIEAVNSLMCGFFGFATAFYTGFLVSVAPSIPFWNTPALPLLFLISAFSTAAGYALLVLMLMRHVNASEKRRVVKLELGLIVFEIMLLLVYFNFAATGTSGARASVAYLSTTPGFWIGVFLFGLMIPLLLDFISLLRRTMNERLEKLMGFASAIFVLVGGYLLRYYILTAGVFEFPY